MSGGGGGGGGSGVAYDDGYSDSDSGNEFAPPPVPVKDACVVTPVAPSGVITETSWTVEAPGAVLHFQIVRLHEQLYVWVGAGDTPAHGELSMAVKTRMSDTPSVTTLLGAGGAPASSAGGGGGGGAANAAGPSLIDSVSNGMAQRLAKRTGMCVVASCNLPHDLADLQVFAERTLLAKLKELGV
mmetsp:Transcript_675/g.1558  ORF Transcript_675/g.1558 Transcript_675/m.1558 type:complete len:185 (-) Transcript_675:153-707(-)|eukprot:CAMPEP_0197574938 /NCGR_PEP_ID=MMETSP1326-20131121/506_1 /TAXON_ID=1155430 /ORGANISM="Genus nov. species nov., Strain RCC2288" /LENGTH=184 /DNA_ID=CAMNT_0043137609 /DNA_START=337 /DNA_END=891 /DNA_ORIENTATION=-